MFSKRHIKVLVSVGVIFMMMLHLVIPHAHHHHEDKKVVSHSNKNDHQHTESHDHQHHDDHDKNKDVDETGLSNPYEKHLHAFHVHEFLPSSKIKQHSPLVKSLPLFTIFTKYDNQPLAENKRSYRFALFRPILYENPFLLSCSLRAPPYSA